MNTPLNYQQSIPQMPQNSTHLLVFHGLLGSLENWNTFCRNQQEKRPLTAVDMRNHGRSQHVKGMSYPLMVADIVQLMDELQLEKADIMGHSMGGKVAMNLALHYPERVGKLIVVDILPKDYDLHHKALMQAMLDIALNELKSRREADQQLASTVKQTFERAFLLKNLQRNADGRFEWRCHLSEIARHYLNISRFPPAEQPYSGETLFIRGAQSHYIQPENWPYAQAYFPRAELVSIEEAGHLPHVQTPDVFIEQVENFLDA